MATNILYALPYQNSARDAIDSNDYGKAFSVIQSIPHGASDGEEILRLAVKNQLYGLLVSNIFSLNQQNPNNCLAQIGILKALEHIALFYGAMKFGAENKPEEVEDRIGDVLDVIRIANEKDYDVGELKRILEEHSEYSNFGSLNEVGEIVESHRKIQEALKTIR